MYVKQIARATIQSPHIDGIINPGGRGHMLTVRFDEPATDLPPPSRTVSQYGVTPSPEQFWNTALNDEGVPANNNSVTLYPSLQSASITARETQRPHYLTTVSHGTIHDPDEVANHWEPISQGAYYSNLWQEVVPVQRFARQKGEQLTNYWLWFADGRGMYDATTPYMGQVNLVADGRNILPDNPCFTLRLWQDAVPDTLTESGCNSFVELWLWHPAMTNSEPVLWSLCLPGPTGSSDDRPKSFLARKSFTGDAWDTEWTVLAEFDANLMVEKSENGSANIGVTWQTIENRIYLSIAGQQFDYWVPSKYRADSNPNPNVNCILQSYPTVYIAGHSCAFNLSPMEFARKAGGASQGQGVGPTGWVESRYTYPIDQRIFNLTGTPSCTLSSVLAASGGLTVKSSGWLPGATYITPSVAGEGTNSAGDTLYRLRVTMEGLAEYERPFVHHATYNWNPLISAGGGTTWFTQGQNWLLSAGGQVTHDWRNASCELILDLDKATADTTAQSWYGNNKVSVVAGWETDTSADVATQFTGYTTSRAMALPADRPERSRVELPCMDGFYRLDKHFWVDLGNFEGFRWDECFHRVLHHCGIPDSMISCSSESSADDSLVPMSRIGTPARFDFAEDTTVPDGLNQLVSSWGMVWGVDQNGTYFVRRPSTYSAYAWTLDDDSLTETDVIYELRAESTFDALNDGQPFVNYVFVRINRGGEEEIAWRWDHDPTNIYRSLSHHVSTNPYFIGDDWHHIFIGQDEASAEDLAARILQDRLRRQCTLNFTAPKKVQLWPDDYVRVQATGIGVVNNSIFKITSKSWRASSPPEGDGSFTATYECVFVQ